MPCASLCSPQPGPASPSTQPASTGSHALYALALRTRLRRRRISLPLDPPPVSWLQEQEEAISS